MKDQIKWVLNTMPKSDDRQLPIMSLSNVAKARFFHSKMCIRDRLNFKEMYEGDFFLTWEKTDDELEAVFTIADALRYMREHNISTKIFESGLGISLFRDNSTRTRFSFASACNLLGLEVQDLDEGKSQIAHGETVRETANMVSFMADVIGIRDDMYIGKGNACLLYTSPQHHAQERRPAAAHHVALQRGQGPLFPQHLPPVLRHPPGPAGRHGPIPVSYTHLDVYKRQTQNSASTRSRPRVRSMA